jgi:hypothetical protein
MPSNIAPDASADQIDVEMGGITSRQEQPQEGVASSMDIFTQALFTGTVPATSSPRTRGSIDRGSAGGRSSTRNTSGKENAPPVETFYCGICLENQAVGDMFEASSCDQKQSHKFCRDCVEGYVISQVKSAATIVSCPGFQPKCKGVFQTEEIRDIVQNSGDGDVAAKFERFLAMSKSENFRECPRALADGSGLCNHPCTTATILSPKIICEKCEYEYCFIHANAHPNEDCRVYSARVLKEEQTNQKFIDETTKHCPSCDVATYKNGGCNHMTCQHCNADWCWICHQKIIGGGGGVTDHYRSGSCAHMQFTRTADGYGDEMPLPGDILLIYRCLGIQDPDTLSPAMRLFCGLINLILVISLNFCTSILVLPMLVIGFALGCACCPCIALGLAFNDES